MKMFIFVSLSAFLLTLSQYTYAGKHPHDDPVPEDWEPCQPFGVNTFKPEEYAADFDFAAQIEKAQELKKQHHRLLWAIGASNDLDSPNKEIERFPAYTVFTDVNRRVMKADGPVHLWMNVKNMKSLQTLPSDFFEDIHVDRATMHQITWEPIHLKEIYRILVPQGKLTFQYVTNILVTEEENDEEISLDRNFVPPLITLNGDKRRAKGLDPYEECINSEEDSLGVKETMDALHKIGFTHIVYHKDQLYPYSNHSTLNFFTAIKPGI